ncbi:MAG: methylenetetrahydrofolate reductase [Solirubrobacterales bacterium]|nr:methylenetetrahydrofolate reductase [Solirubrobacterales bacterium]
MVGLLQRPRLEVIPLPGVEQDVLDYIPRTLTVTVTSSPARGPGSTLELTERLAGHGYRVVPHLAARTIADSAQLAEVLQRIDAVGVREVFVVAGDIPKPAGQFEGAAQLLAVMAQLDHRLERIGITGYPESHAFISDEATIQAMFDKVPFASYIVSQICFDAAVIAQWIRRVRERGVALPIYIGLPGPIDPVRLLRLSRRVGLGDSARFLRRHGSWLGRLVSPRSYRPEVLLERLAPVLGRADNGIAGLHLYTFNEVAQTEQWRARKLELLGNLGGDQA